MWPITALESGEVGTNGNLKPQNLGTLVLDRTWFGLVASWRGLLEELLTLIMLN
jgi:hypothetical protein